MEIFHILSEWMVTLYICLFFQIVGNNAYHKNWNHCPLQSDALRLLPHVAFKECWNQCNIRNHCKLICYRTATKMCEIHGQNPQITTCKRCVSVIQEDIPVEQSGTTIACDCDHGKTCDPSTGSCDYAECGESSFPSGKTYGEMYGNLANVGAKRITQCKNSTKESAEISCSSTGNWVEVPSCEHICPSHDMIYTLTGGIQILICNQPVKQPVAKQYCSILGGTLIKLDTAEKMSALRQLISEDSGLINDDYWTDGYSQEARNHKGWHFTDGTQMPMVQGVFWYYGTPDGGSKPSCVRLWHVGDHRWNDRACDIRFHYICQIQ